MSETRSDILRDPVTKDLRLEPLDFTDLDDLMGSGDNSKPVTSFGAGLVSTVFSPSSVATFITRTLREALPLGYQKAINATQNLYNSSNETVSELFSENAEAIASLSSSLQETNSSLSGFAPKALTDAVSRSLKSVREQALNARVGGPTDSLNPGQSDKEATDELNNFLGEQFANTQVAVTEYTEKRADQRAASERKERTIRDRVNGTWMKGLIVSQQETTRQIGLTNRFHNDVHTKFMRRSLEVQYRTFQAIRDIRKVSELQYKAQVEGFKNLTINSSLPDLAKSENYRPKRNKLLNIGGAGFSDYLRDFGSNFKKNLKTGLSAQLQSSLMAGDMGLMGANTMSSMVGMTGWRDKGEMAGDFLGPMLTNIFAPQLGRMMKGWFSKMSDRIGGQHNLSEYYIDNMESMLQEYQGNYGQTGLKGFLHRLVSPYIPTYYQNTALSNSGFKNTNRPAQFNQLTQRSIVEIIPGLLSRIHREIRVLRTGDESTPLITYDTTRGKFTTAKATRERLVDQIVSPQQRDNAKYGLDTVISEFAGDRQLSPAADKALRLHLIKTTATNGRFNPEALTSEYAFSDQKEEVGEELRSLFRDRYAFDDDGRLQRNASNNEQLNNDSKLFRQLHQVIPTKNNEDEIRRLLDSGMQSDLLRLGVVRSKFGNDVIDMDRLYELLIDHDGKLDRREKGYSDGRDGKRGPGGGGPTGGSGGGNNQSNHRYFVKGRSIPSLTEEEFRLGRYFDAIHRRPIRDIKNVRGPVIDANDNIVVSAQELAIGLVDEDGNEVVRIGSAVGDLVRNGLGDGTEDSGNSGSTGNGIISRIRRTLNNDDGDQADDIHLLDLASRVRHTPAEIARRVQEYRDNPDAIRRDFEHVKRSLASLGSRGRTAINGQIDQIRENVDPSIIQLGHDAVNLGRRATSGTIDFANQQWQNYGRDAVGAASQRANDAWRGTQGYRDWISQHASTGWSNTAGLRGDASDWINSHTAGLRNYLGGISRRIGIDDIDLGSFSPEQIAENVTSTVQEARDRVRDYRNDPSLIERDRHQLGRYLRVLKRRGKRKVLDVSRKLTEYYREYMNRSDTTDEEGDDTGSVGGSRSFTDRASGVFGAGLDWLSQNRDEWSSRISDIIDRHTGGDEESDSDDDHEDGTNKSWYAKWRQTRRDRRERLDYEKLYEQLLEERDASGFEEGEEIQDIYIRGLGKPALLKRDLEAGKYFDVNTGEVVKRLSEIKGPLVNADGDYVLTQDDIDNGLFTKYGTRLDRLAKTLNGRFGEATGLKGYVESLRNIKRRVIGLKRIPHVLGLSRSAMDVYVEGESLPRLKAVKMRAGEYIDLKSDRPVYSTDDIRGAVADLEGNIVLDENEIHRLVDRNGRRIRLAGRLLRGLRWAGRKYWDFTKWYYKTVPKAVMKGLWKGGLWGADKASRLAALPLNLMYDMIRSPGHTARNAFTNSAKLGVSAITGAGRAALAVGHGLGSVSRGIGEGLRSLGGVPEVERDADGNVVRRPGIVRRAISRIYSFLAGQVVSGSRRIRNMKLFAENPIAALLAGVNNKLADMLHRNDPDEPDREGGWRRLFNGRIGGALAAGGTALGAGAKSLWSSLAGRLGRGRNGDGENGGTGANGNPSNNNDGNTARDAAAGGVLGYLGSKALAGTKWVGSKAWAGTKWAGGKVWDGTKWVARETPAVIAEKAPILLRLGKAANVAGVVAEGMRPTKLSDQDSVYGGTVANPHDTMSYREQWSYSNRLSAAEERLRKGEIKTIEEGLSKEDQAIYKQQRRFDIWSKTSMDYARPYQSIDQRRMYTAGSTDKGASPIRQISSKTGTEIFVPNKLTKLQTIRFFAYGLSTHGTQTIEEILSLEQQLAPWVKYDGADVSINIPQEDLTRIGSPIFGFSSKDDDKRFTRYATWVSNRFIPVYLAWLRGMNQLNKGFTAINSDNNIKLRDQYTVAKLVVSANGPSGETIWDVDANPFGEDTSVTHKNAESVLSELQAQLKEEEKNQLELDQSNNDYNTTKANILNYSEQQKALGFRSDDDHSTGTVTKKANPYADAGNGTDSSSRGNSASMGIPLASTYAGGGLSAPDTSPPPEAGPGNGVVQNTGIPLSSAASGTGGTWEKIPLPSHEGVQSAAAPTIRAAANMVGIDPDMAIRMAGAESGFISRAKAGQGSASGWFQFISETFNTMVRRYGKLYGIEVKNIKNDPRRFDPRINSLMGAHYIKENITGLAGALGHTPTDTEVYMAHFLGLDGAKAFFKLPRDRPAADFMSKSVVDMNKGIFFMKDGTKRTVQQVYEEMDKRLHAPHGRKQGIPFSLDGSTQATTQTPTAPTQLDGTNRISDLLPGGSPLNSLARSASDTRVPAVSFTPKAPVLQTPPTPPVGADGSDSSSTPTVTSPPAMKSAPVVDPQRIAAEQRRDFFVETNSLMKDQLDTQKEIASSMVTIVDLLKESKQKAAQSSSEQPSQTDRVPYAQGQAPVKELISNSVRRNFN